MMGKEQVEHIIEQTEGARVVTDFAPFDGGGLTGRIAVNAGEGGKEIEWEVRISSCYPFKVMGEEPIKFVNKELMDYPHIMEEGNLCMHPAVYDNAEAQLTHDLEQLKEWVDKYYVRGERNEHYEHLVVNRTLTRKTYYNVWFADTERDINVGDYGEVSFAVMSDGRLLGNVTTTLLVTAYESHQYFKSEKNQCKVSKTYRDLAKCSGVYCMLKEIPSVHNKFIIRAYRELERLMSQQQMDFLHSFENHYRGDKGFFPLMVGYKIPDGSIHWQAAMLFMDDLPIEGYKMGAGKYREWHTKFVNGQIEWAHTENVSYHHFFGRGSMTKELADKKMLVIGIGAIGSMVAVVLTRCGARYVNLNDIDIKESGNVCRSEYRFIAGGGDKSVELLIALRHISPHVECEIVSPVLDMGVKGLSVTETGREAVMKKLEEYDIIFDCTSDNQLMQVLDGLDYKGRIVNLSITNHAQDLVCAFSPNVSRTVRFIYEMLGRDSEQDLYNPTGCWAPTFKASYNDIASKVQYAMKRVIKMLGNEEPIGNFYLSEDENSLKMVRV